MLNMERLDRIVKDVDAALAASPAGATKLEVLRTYLEEDSLKRAFADAEHGLTHDEADVFTLAYDAWLDVAAMRARTDSLMTVDESLNVWQQAYNADMAELLTESGQVVRFKHSFYGWCDYQESQKTENLTVVALFNAVEDSWTEFAGSGNLGDEEVGVFAEALYSDGVVRWLRWEGDFSEVIMSKIRRSWK